MIRYRLSCKKGHEFESWFASSAAFDSLADKKQVACPTCGSKSVQKALMAPGVVKSEAKSASKRAIARAARAARQEEGDKAPAVPSNHPGEMQTVTAHTELVAAIRKLRSEVQANAEYVGRRFAEEARKIHHEEAPHRGIYGEATMEEARALLDEGVEVLPLPGLPEDHN